MYLATFVIGATIGFIGGILFVIYEATSTSNDDWS